MRYRWRELPGSAPGVPGRACRASIVANGELYNYRALRRQFTAEGVRFATNSDTEPALHCYLKYGDSFLKHLPGMYALGLLDRERDEILLARDPFGIKPLYYLEGDWGVAFASELQAFAAAGLLRPRVDAELLPVFLRDQFVSGHRTLIRDVRRVLPGELLRIRAGRIVGRHRAPPHLPPIVRRSGAAAAEVFAGYRRYRDPAWRRWLRQLRGRTGRPGLPSAGPGLPPPAVTRHWTALQRLQADDLFGWLPGDLLTKLDRTLIHYGVEGRVPFLDERCAAFGFSLADALKVRRGFGKFLLRDWFAAHQQAVSAWERKQGFAVPIRAWLGTRRGLLDAFLAHHEGIQSMVPVAVLAKAMHPAPLGTHQAQLNYRLLCFALWYDAFVAGRTTTAEVFAPAVRSAPSAPVLA